MIRPPSFPLFNRLRIPELEDQGWFPAILRNYQTDFLGIAAKLIKLYEPLIPVLGRNASAKCAICDLCSGNGAAAIYATAGARKAGAKLILTDKFPNTNFQDYVQLNSVEYSKISVDILHDRLPKAETYTMFNGLHHFNERQIEQVITKIKAQNGDALFIEPLQPNFAVLLKVMIATTLGALLFIPFIRPFRWYHFVFTYLIPIGIIATMWDGIASVINAYSQGQLLKIASELEKKGIEARFEVYRGKFATLFILRS